MSPTTAQKVGRLKRIMERIEADAERALMTYQMMIRLNDDVRLRKLFDGTDAVHGRNVIYAALLHEAMILLVRMYDGPGRGGYDKSDKASLLIVLHLLSDEDVIRAFAEETRNWYPGRYLEERHARDVTQALSRARERLIQLTEREPGTVWLRTMRDFRDGNLAHSLVRSVEPEPPVFGSIGELLQATMPIVRDLLFGVQGLPWDWEEIEAGAKKMSDAFWAALAAGRLPAD